MRLELLLLVVTEKQLKIFGTYLSKLQSFHFICLLETFEINQDSNYWKLIIIVKFKVTVYEM